MRNFWTKSIFVFLILFPISFFLHETGHWMIYEINGIDSWMSLQRANLVHPDLLTEDVFLKALFGGPVLTFILALGALVLLTKYPSSIWLLVLGLINSTFRILPTLIGLITASKKDLNGVSDEGNIVLRLFDSVVTRELTLILLLVFYIVSIILLYKVFQFPSNFKRKKIFIWTLCLLTILISLTYPKLDSLIFGI